MKMVRPVALAVLVLIGGILSAAEPLKSGPQIGELVPGPFEPLNLNGEKAGEPYCLYCHNGINPVAMIFARSSSPQLTTLIRKLDTATAANKQAHMGSFVVYLTDSDTLPKQLRELAKKEKIEQTILGVMDPAGPEGYELSKEADVTVVLYTRGIVKANHVFRKGELNDTSIGRVLADLPKIIGAK